MGEVIIEKKKLALSSSPSSSESECEELQLLEHAPPFWRNRKRLSKQLSMCETSRDIAWEKRRRQIFQQQRKKLSPGINIDHRRMDVSDDNNNNNLTDEDLSELKGCIELGFGFNEEEGQRLCSTFPALDLYFAVNRQYSISPVSSPGSKSLPSPPTSTSGSSLGARSSSFGSPISDSSDAWRLFSPGDDPQQVKTKLRHWAQAVACSVMQSH